MAKLTRRSFIAATLAAATVRSLPMIATKAPVRHVVTLVYDKGLGMMRVIDKVIP